MSTTTLPRLLTAQETAEYLGLTPTTLANQRSLGLGIPFVRVGNRVRYKESDVRAYVEANTVAPVSAA